MVPGAGDPGEHATAASPDDQQVVGAARYLEQDAARLAAPHDRPD